MPDVKEASASIGVLHDGEGAFSKEHRSARYRGSYTATMILETALSWQHVHPLSLIPPSFLISVADAGDVAEISVKIVLIPLLLELWADLFSSLSKQILTCVYTFRGLLQ